MFRYLNDSQGNKLTQKYRGVRWIKLNTACLKAIDWIQEKSPLTNRIGSDFLEKRNLVAPVMEIIMRDYFG